MKSKMGGAQAASTLPSQEGEVGRPLVIKYGPSAMVPPEKRREKELPADEEGYKKSFAQRRRDRRGERMKIRVSLLAGMFLLMGCSQERDVDVEAASNTISEGVAIGCILNDSSTTNGSNDLSPQPAEFDSVAIVKSPVIMKNIYSSRNPSKRGSGVTSEDVVTQALRWFSKIQNEDGSWSTDKDPKALSTGLVLLCYLAHGETPASTYFGKTVEKGMKYLLENQSDDGRFKGTEKNPALEHGIVTYASCEAYGLTKVPMIQESAKKALYVVLKARQESGLWGSKYAQDEVDIEVSVWQIIALKSALMAGIEYERVKPALKKAGEGLKQYLVEHRDEKGIAPIIHAMQYTEQNRTPLWKERVKDLKGVKMNWDEPEYEDPVYQWFFIGRAMFYNGGEYWAEWNQSFAPALVKRQEIDPTSAKDHRDILRDCGYWDSPGKGERYGRIYSTALCCQMLEVYYCYHYRRHVPIVIKEPPADDAEEDIDITIDI